jgi:hypothetical protein
MVPANPPIEQIAADLRRMLRTNDRVVGTRHIATTSRRVRALEAAISTSALQAAWALEVTHPTTAPYSGLETYQPRRLLQALTAEGLALPADLGLPDSASSLRRSRPAAGRRCPVRLPLVVDGSGKAPGGIVPVLAG